MVKLMNVFSFFTANESNSVIFKRLNILKLRIPLQEPLK